MKFLIKEIIITVLLIMIDILGVYSFIDLLNNGHVIGDTLDNTFKYGFVILMIISNFFYFFKKL